MAKTQTIHARVAPDLKAEVERILKKLGMNTTDAINLYFNQIKLKKGLPFEIKIPNKTTLETFKKTDKGEELTSYNSLEEFFEKMGA